MPRFRLRSLLALVAFVAVSLASLVRPSSYWSLAMPPMMTLICAFGVYRAVASSRSRALWASFIAALVSYCLTVVFLRELGWNQWTAYICAPLWHLIHGVVPVSSDVNGYSTLDLSNFSVSLHVICAVLISGIAALTAQKFSNDET
jgi:hypothetical protein